MPIASEPSLPNASFDELSTADCRSLAALHVRCLPDSLISRLGRGYAEAFYRYVRRSRQEFAFLHRQAGQITSAGVLSLQPRTLQRRLATGTPLLLWAALRLFHLPVGKILKEMFRARPPAKPETTGDGDAALDQAPELALLFTAPEARGRGLATALLARCERFLAAQGYRQYVIKTFDYESNPALRFYAHTGFVERCRFVKHGQAFRMMAKTLAG